RPAGGVLFASGQRCAHGVHTGHELAFGAEHVEHGLAHAGHQLLIHGHVGAVGQFDPDVGDVRAEWAHAERHHVHRAASHAAVKQRLQRGAHFSGVHPVVGGAGVFLFLGANVGTVFHAG